MHKNRKNSRDRKNSKERKGRREEGPTGPSGQADFVGSVFLFLRFLWFLLFLRVWRPSPPLPSWPTCLPPLPLDQSPPLRPHPLTKMPSPLDQQWFSLSVKKWPQRIHDGTPSNKLIVIINNNGNDVLLLFSNIDCSFGKLSAWHADRLPCRALGMLSALGMWDVHFLHMCTQICWQALGMPSGWHAAHLVD